MSDQDGAKPLQITHTPPMLPLESRKVGLAIRVSSYLFWFLLILMYLISNYKNWTWFFIFMEIWIWNWNNYFTHQAQMASLCYRIHAVSKSVLQIHTVEILSSKIKNKIGFFKHNFIAEIWGFMSVHSVRCQRPWLILRHLYIPVFNFLFPNYFQLPYWCSHKIK